MKNSFLFNCDICKTRCDGKSLGIYIFKNDTEFSENFEKITIKYINTKSPLFAKSTDTTGYPDIEIYKKKKLKSFVEIKAQQRTFMSVQRLLPKSDLKPSDQLILLRNGSRRTISRIILYRILRKNPLIPKNSEYKFLISV